MDTSIIIDYLKALGGLPCLCPNHTDFLKYKEELDKYKYQFESVIVNVAFETDAKGIKYFRNEFEKSMEYARKHMNGCRKGNEEDPTLLCYQEAYSHARLSVEQIKQLMAGFNLEPTEKASSVSPDSAPFPKPSCEHSQERMKPVVLSGTQELADFLGCSKSTAFKIIKSGVLDGKTQYMTKGVWKFNVERLEKAVRENPKIFK